MIEEREVTCAGCGGDGCVECGERGSYCAEFEPVTMEDLAVRGPDCACCERQPSKDCAVPGCGMKDVEWALHGRTSNGE